MAIMRLNKNTFRISRPMNQNILVGVIFFCLPGIYTAVVGLGAGGGRSSSGRVANQTNSILYGMFALFGFLGGTIVNLLRPKLSMMFGSIGYPLYVGSMWFYDQTGQTWFPLFAGAVLGCTVGILMTCAVMISISYPEEHQKGLFIAQQWMIRSIGASVGSAIALSVNIDKATPEGIGGGVYLTYVIIQCLPLFIAGFFIIDPKNVVRDDGTHLALFKPLTFKQQLKAFVKCFTNRQLLIMFPALLGCDMALALTSTINGFYFNLRTRSLNNFIFQVVQFFGSLIMIFILDSKYITSRKRRGLVGIVFMGVVSIAACGGLYGWLETVKFTSFTSTPARDWTHSTYPGLLVLYMLFGLIYSAYQLLAQWVIGCLSNDPTVLAQYSGFMTGSFSLGICISFVIAAEGVPQWGQVTFQFILYVFGVIGMAYIMMYEVKESNYFREENTIAPVYVEQQEAVKDENAAENQPVEESRQEKIASGISTNESCSNSQLNTREVGVSKA